jgi:D-inositol-3-phosphate glycosyltransferase
MVSNSKGHIAFISVHGDPMASLGQDGAGGQNVYVRKIGEALAQRGWKVDMFTRRTDPEQLEVTEHFPGCRTIHLTAGPQIYINRDNLFATLPNFVEAFLEFQDAQKIIYPLIHTNYWLSSWVGMQLRNKQLLKHIHTYHSLGAVKYRSIATIPMIAKTRLAIEKDCLETTNCVVATSIEEKGDMRTWVSENGTIEVIPCGVDLQNFQVVPQAVARQQLDLALDQKIVLYVGRFDPRKGIDTVLQALEHPSLRTQPKFQVLLVGGGNSQLDQQEQKRLEQLVQDKGLSTSVTFVGAVEHAHLAQYYAAADVCVVPSHYEPFGLVAVEAMACSTPVVASNVGGLRYSVVSGETGLLVPPQDATAFATAIARILDNPAERDRMGQNGRARVESTFDWHIVAEHLDHLYTKQLASLSQEFFQETTKTATTKVA